MQSKEQIVEQLEISLEHAKSVVERKEALERLMENRDFKNIILDGYFEKEPMRLVSLLRDDAFKSDEDQQSLLDDMKGISSFRQYLLGLKQLGSQMEITIRNHEEEIERLENEEG